MTEATEREQDMTGSEGPTDGAPARRSRVVAVPRRAASRDAMSPQGSRIRPVEDVTETDTETDADTDADEDSADYQNSVDYQNSDDYEDPAGYEEPEHALNGLAEPPPPRNGEDFIYAPWETPPGKRPVPAKVPKTGWRGALYGLSGKTINVGMSPAEYELEQRLRVIRAPVSSHSITTMNIKGGAGKTTTAMALGTVLATYRRDRCIGIDANPDRGNLAQRVGQEHTYTIRDMLDNLHQITGDNALRRYTNQAPSRFEVIAADRDPVKARAFTPEEYRTVQQVVRAFRQVIITDTGIDLTNPVVDAVLELTDTLVVAASTAQDVAGLAWETLETVEHRGYRRLVENAVVAIVDESGRDQVPISALTSAFQQRCANVVVIPHERSLVGGGWFDWDALSGRTKRSYLELTAKVATGFRR